MKLLALVTLAVLALPGCGGPAPRGPATTAAARSFAHGPAPTAGDAGMCPGGTAEGCVRAGDTAAARDPDAAEAHWLTGCRAGAAAGCARLMAATAFDPGLADEYGRLACELGDATACSMLARSQYVRWRASREMPRLQRAAAMFERGCELNDWSSCWMGSVVYGTRGLDVPERALALQQLAVPRAASACAKSDAIACEQLGEHALASGGADNAGALFARACALQLSGSGEAERTKLLDERACAQARSLGATIPDSVAVPASEARWLHADRLAATRTAGRTLLLPSDDIKRAMQRKAQTRMVLRLRVRVSDLGKISEIRIFESSGFPGYDRDVFDQVRTWRYTPHLLDGVPSEVLTTITFIYNQRN